MSLRLFSLTRVNLITFSTISPNLLHINEQYACNNCYFPINQIWLFGLIFLSLILSIDCFKDNIFQCLSNSLLWPQTTLYYLDSQHLSHICCQNIQKSMIFKIINSNCSIILTAWAPLSQYLLIIPPTDKTPSSEWGSIPNILRLSHGTLFHPSINSSPFVLNYKLKPIPQK